MSDASTAERLSLKFGFIKFMVRDLEAMSAFYGRAFGLEPTRRIEADTLVELVMRPSKDDTGFCLVLCQFRDGREITLGSAYGALAFFVGSARQAYERALEAGASPLTPPYEVRGMEVAFALDPEGRELEFISSDNGPPR